MRKALTAAVALSLATLATDALAIVDLEVNASIPFSFTSPGARSLGMAGAFVGLADDATAAYTNPAGLTQLRQTEVSVEVRRTKFDTPFADGGTFDEGNFDASTVGSDHVTSSKNNPSFISIVVPYDRWAFAFYRHELARYSAQFTRATINGDLIYLFPLATKTDLRIDNLGASAAFKVNDAWSLGFGLSRYGLRLDTAAVRFDNGKLVAAQLQNGDENAIGWNVGARWNASDTLSLGLIYRKAPQFRYRASSFVLNPNNPNDPTSTTILDRVRFNVPDVWGAGVTWRPSDTWLVNFDVDRVRYGELTGGIQTLFGYPDSTRRLNVPNGTEVHLGTEYTFATMAHPLSLRGGVWRDPRHSISFKGEPGNNCQNNEGDCVDVALAALCSKGRGPETHVSVGAGMAFKSFQVDLAGDFSNAVDTWSLSGVYRF